MRLGVSEYENWGLKYVIYKVLVPQGGPPRFWTKIMTKAFKMIKEMSHFLDQKILTFLAQLRPGQPMRRMRGAIPATQALSRRRSHSPGRWPRGRASTSKGLKHPGADLRHPIYRLLSPFRIPLTGGRLCHPFERQVTNMQHMNRPA